MYAEQARHYMQQHEKYVDADIKVTDPLEKANYQGRLSDIERQLSRIRKDARQLYREMNRMILCIGGTMLPIQSGTQRALTL